MNKTRELSIFEQICRDRIKKLINEYCEGSQQRFVDRTGLNKGSVSQYVSGKNTPSRANAQKISDAFNVDVSWVMGHDLIPPGIGGHINESDVIRAIDLYGRFQDSPPEVRAAVELLLKAPQQPPESPGRKI
jgi:transcriptional regulator with XRE-family HTH domain